MLATELLAYLRGQPLGRLATVDHAGAPQVNPVGFILDEASGQIAIRGMAEALTDADPPRPGMSRELIWITATWIGSWGIDPSRPGLHGRGS